MSARARAALAYVALFAAIGAQAPYLVLYYQSLGVDLPAIGGLVSLASLVGLGAAPAWGHLSDRLRGSPLVLLAAAGTAVIGAIGLSQARALESVVPAAIVMALGSAGLSPILDARALETAGGDRAGYGPLRAWGSASYIVFAFGTGAVIQRFGIGAMFAVLSVALAATAAIGLTLRSSIVRPVAPRQGSLIALVRRERLGSFLAGAFVTWAALGAVMGFYSLRLEEVGGTATTVGLAAALGAAVEVPIMLAFPRLVTRFGPVRLVTAGAAVFVLRAAMAAMLTDPAALVIASGIGGIGFALFLVGAVTHVSRSVPPELAATAQGVYQGVSVGFGQVSAAAIGGAIAGAVGLAGLYSVATVVAAVATALVWLAVRPRRLVDPRRAGSTAGVG